MKAVKFGIIGTGAIARVHAEAIRLSGNCKLVCVYDKIPERAAAFAAAHGCRAAASLRERDWRNRPEKLMVVFLQSLRRMKMIREETLTTGAATRGVNTWGWGGSLRRPRPMASR